MIASAPDTSSISFTALYTGQVWVRHGLAEPFFRTRRGALLYAALTPAEMAGRRVLGGNIRTFLLQRHYLIDARLEALVAACPDLQVVEIACGLSPRGCRFRERHPALDYVEADLPAMAVRKRRLLQRHHRLGPKHRVEAVNVFAPKASQHSVEALLAGLDAARPVAVITEGLVNYFSLAAISPFWRRLAEALRAFPAGIYLSDSYPLYPGTGFPRTRLALASALGALSQSRVSFHFRSDDEIRRHFPELGFESVQVHDPAHHYGALPIPRTRGTPMVRVLEARAVSSPSPERLY